MNPFRKITKLPVLNPNAIERAVAQFVKESHTAETGADEMGLYQQTLESIATAVLFNPGDARQFWMADKDGEVVAYALCHISKDVDNQLCFWVTQGWVHKSLKGTAVAKEWFSLAYLEAERLMCKHIIIPSSRSPKAYCRFLGEGWHEYVTLLKKDI